MNKTEYAQLSYDERVRGKPCPHCTKIPNNGASWKHAPDCLIGAENKKIRDRQKEWAAEMANERELAAELERAAISVKQSVCPHHYDGSLAFIVVSHEEVKCRYCGAYFFIPD